MENLLRSAFAPFRSVRWLAVLVLCAAPGSTVLAFAGNTDATPDAIRDAHPIQTVDHDLEVRWQARILDAGGEFVLYGGDGLDLRVLTRLAAEDSQQRYSFKDAASASGRRTYQLRYRDRQGREHVLATTVVEVEVISAGGDLTSTHPSAASILATLPGQQGGQLEDSLEALQLGLPDGWHARPHSPPPRYNPLQG